MIKKVLLFAFIILSFLANAQKAQRIGYIDMEYILENIPEYKEAQSKINAKAIVWQNNIVQQEKEIEALKAELNNEKELLTEELIIEKEEDIQILEFDLKELQAAYFGSNGDLYFLRQQLVKPIQDLVFNAVQDIATKRKYDFVLDKSSSLVMLYSNKDFDISDMIITNITRSKKVAEVEEKQNKRNSTNSEPEVLNEEAQQKITDKETKQEELKKKIDERKAAQLKKREELKAVIEAKRQQRIQDIEDAKKAKEQKENN